MESFSDTHLDLPYPCLWTYTLIGADEVLMRSAAAAAAGDRDFSIRPSHTSKGGNYCSLHFEVMVGDERERLAIFDELKHHPHVRFLL